MNESTWKGSVNTASSVAKEIMQRWGEQELENYDPLKNCFTYNRWRTEGYQVKKGEKAIKSFSIKETKDGKKFPISVSLFYFKQVQKI